MGADERSTDDKKWDSKLDEYRFNTCDKLDAAIMEGVERGFFDEAEIANQARQQHTRQEAAAAQEALYQAWRAFYYTFDTSSGADVAGDVYAACKQHMNHVSLGNLDDAVGILKALGLVDKASELIASYIDTHRDHIRSVDEHIRSVDEAAKPFHPVVKDDELRTALVAAVVSPPPKPIKDILISLYEGKPNKKDIEAACALSADDLYALFKGLRGEELYPVVEGSLFYRKMSNATDPQRALTRNAREALERIGRESTINAIRVKKFGVEISEVAPTVGDPPVTPAALSV